MGSPEGGQVAGVLGCHPPSVAGADPQSLRAERGPAGQGKASWSSQHLSLQKPGNRPPEGLEVLGGQKPKSAHCQRSSEAVRQLCAGGQPQAPMSPRERGHVPRCPPQTLGHASTSVPFVFGLLPRRTALRPLGARSLGPLCQGRYPSSPHTHSVPGSSLSTFHVLTPHHKPPKLEFFLSLSANEETEAGRLRNSPS